MRRKGMVGAGILGAVAALTTIGAAAASADTIYRTPNPADLYDLEHQKLYTWRIDNLDLTNQTITGASLSFNNIRNWDNNDNRLFVWMFDTAKNAGVSTFTDDTTNSNWAPIVDDFANDRYHDNWRFPIAEGTDGIKLTDKEFSSRATDWTYNFTTAQISSLTSFLSSGNNVAFGFDPDCHFYNDGIKLKITTTPNNTVIPEPGTFALVAAGALPLMGAVIRRRRNVG